MFFGDYDKPDLLKQLEEYQQTPGQHWEHLGFYIAYDYHYAITPLDVIPFAGTGMDGIHFGFLTDFGTVTDLDKAPIVCVSPTNDPPIKLVAKDLQDFLRLVVAVGYADFLDWDYDTDEEITMRIHERDDVPEVDWQGNRLAADKRKQQAADIQQDRIHLTKMLQDQYRIDPMPNVVQYIKDLRTARQTEITIETSDNLGITYQTDHLTIDDFDYSIKDNNQIQDYLDNASQDERIKFYRDATYQYILNKDYDNDIKKTIIASLKKDGYKREALILEKKY